MDDSHPNHYEGHISASRVNTQDGSTEAQISSRPTTATAKSGSDVELPPPKPPRPMNPLEQAEATLKEAFPSIDAAVVKAVLTASGGKVEPAFNALLGMCSDVTQTDMMEINAYGEGMSDPDALEEQTPPPQPPRPNQIPSASDKVTSTPQNQLEADELYARQLAEHYSGGASHGYQQMRRGTNRDQLLPPRKKETGLKPNELYDEQHSFLDGIP